MHRIEREVKERVALELLSETRISTINEKYNLNNNTVRNWKRSDEEFQIFYREAAEDVLDSAMADLKGLLGDSVARLRTLVNDTDSKTALDALRIVFSQYDLKNYVVPKLEQLEEKSRELTSEKFSEIFGDV